MTLKTVLKNFLNYADTLDGHKKLGKDLYEIDFQKLKRLTEELKRDDDYSTSEGLKEVNRRKNRYKDILPYDYTRVILSEYPGVPGSDYINANFIKGASGSLAYIASQGPLPNTVVDFWRMIWECEIQVIVMACNEQESGKYKCECYWPVDEEKKQYGNINVEFVKWRQVCPDFLVRTLKACWESEERIICQFHYTTWPDHGVPNSVQPILELVRLIRDCQASEAVPVLVHCSAGCGRTGTICAIDFVWGLMRMGKLSPSFNLFNVIADMRRQRIAMVQTKEQYVLVHKAVSSLFEQQLRVIDSHTYENLDEDGEPLAFKEMKQKAKEEDIYVTISDVFDDPPDERNGDRRLLPSLPEPYTELLLDGKRGHSGNLQHYKTLAHVPTSCDSNQNEVKDKDKIIYASRLENEKEVETEKDSSYSKNSRTLKKLRREESVKKLISGWNKAVEQGTDHATPGHDAKTATSKSYLDNYDQDTPQSINAQSQTYAHDVPISSSGQRAADAKGEEQQKISSPEDTRMGKLVGKATVIRRPSIAKLKALFEKNASSSAEHSSETSRHHHHHHHHHRRPLFRSHSHYVSPSSRTYSYSDSTDQTSDRTEPIYGSRAESSYDRDSSDPPPYVERRKGSLSSAISTRHSEKDKSYSHCDPSHRFSYPASSACFRDSNITSRDSEDDANSLESTFCVYQSDQSSSRTQSKQYFDGEKSTSKQPELPVKRKALPPPPLELNSERTVPRYKVNSNFPSSSGYESKTGSQNDTDSEKIYERNRTLNYKRSVPISNYETEDSSLEYRRHSQEVERSVLCKNQSFSDPEQGSARSLEIAKQMAKSVFSDQTHPKLLAYSTGKTASDDRLLSSYDTSYVNVNSVAQKNIRQIEDKLKNHPRGAIIDLTSRKSYIDEMTGEPNYVFQNTSEPVKCIQPQESHDLTRQKHSSSKIDRIQNTVRSPINVATRTPDQKGDSSKKDYDLDDPKNLLLHSPPPKTRRGHPTKSLPKLPTSPPVSSSVPTPPTANKAVQSHLDERQSPIEPKAPASSPVTVSPATTSTYSGAPADRSDPRYFPVHRQTVMDAKYESERHKALSSERYGQANVANPNEPQYSIKNVVAPIYQKLPISYDKFKSPNKQNSEQKTPVSDSSKSHSSTKTSDYEPLYGLQRSKSGPQILPPHSEPPRKPSESDVSRLVSVFNQASGEHKRNKSFPGTESSRRSQHENNSYHPPDQSFRTGPPKPPRTYHHDFKSEREVPSGSETQPPDPSSKMDGGRYIVTVASPKQNSTYSVPPKSPAIRNSEHRPASHNPDYSVPPPPASCSSEYRLPSASHNSEYSVPPPPSEYRHPDKRYPDTGHYSTIKTSTPYQYIPQQPKEVPLSKSYPLSNYDYIHPRPYGKQFHPESMHFRNVQPFGPSDYASGQPNPSNVYATVKHRYSDYENVYDPRYVGRGLKYSNANVYGVTKSQYVNVPVKDYPDDGSSPKKGYFDTLQRRHKQVSWDQRRSADDMDIRPAPSARLREQMHARRSLVELDNLEIAVVSDEGENIMPPPFPLNKSGGKNGQSAEPISKTIDSSAKASVQKRNSAHNRETATFGETLSKAFGRLTSLTKFSGKETQTGSSGLSDSSSNGSKGSKSKEKPHNYDVQSPPREKQVPHSYNVQSPASSNESTSEQWTQV